MSTIPNRDDGEHQDVGPEPKPKPKRPPYAQLPYYVLTCPGLSAGDRELYAHLDTFWRDKSVCYPSQETLAERMGVNVSTVRRRTRKLEKAKLVKVKRIGLTASNRYVKLPPPKPELRVVPAADDGPDDAGSEAEQAPARAPDRASTRALHRSPASGEVNAVEADTRERDMLSVDGAAKNAPPSRARPDEHPLDKETDEALVALVEALSDSDTRTFKVFRRDFGHLHADAVWFALDVLEERQRRAHTSPSAYDPIDNEAGYARGILEAVANGYSRYDDWSAFFGHGAV